MPTRGALMLHQDDNVATTIQQAMAGAVLEIRLGNRTWPLDVVQEIPFGFKVALVDIPQGAEVVKYGVPIGIASQPIAAGALVHIHNLVGARGRGDLSQEGQA